MLLAFFFPLRRNEPESCISSYLCLRSLILWSLYADDVLLSLRFASAAQETAAFPLFIVCFALIADVARCALHPIS